MTQEERRTVEILSFVEGYQQLEFEGKRFKVIHVGDGLDYTMYIFGTNNELLGTDNWGFSDGPLEYEPEEWLRKHGHIN